VETPAAIAALNVVGGNVALDFVNTRPGNPAEVEPIADYAALVAWAVHAGQLDAPTAERLLQRASSDDRAAERSVAGARELRQELWSLFSAVADSRQPPPDVLDALRVADADSLAAGQLVNAERGYGWSWRDDQTLDRPVHEIAHAAVELLTSTPLDRVKTCPACTYIFLDETKNRSRRWCSMDDCGTAEKTRRFVAKRAAKRSSRSSSGGD
jgi:predicted RNA-binding Zn ribbon-like protein